MNRQTSDITHNNSSSNLSFLELVEEMKGLGMDPRPLLEIAANDIWTRHGAQAMTYTELMLHQMQEENNPDGIYLWQALFDLLKDRQLDAHFTIH
ncbi:MAG: hypothetical protein JKY45_10380 [Emcibacter sp.]|nr:hypothetical protein [Emcibacter sp.]